MKKVTYYILMLIMAVLLIACNKKNKYNEEEDITVTEAPDSDKVSPTITPQPTAPAEDTTPSPTTTPVDEGHPGEMRSYLTGLWVPETYGKNRPYAIQFSNFKKVSNQSGIMEADIVYEALVEGGITRLLGIGENYTGSRIGSIRSSRHYFASIADEYDAIYIHYGKTKYAKSKLKQLAINNLDGETGIGSKVFYRDKSIAAPHNAFTSKERILEGIKSKGYRTEYVDGYKPHFSFNLENVIPVSGDKADKVTIKYSSYISPYFVYNSSDNLYYRYQFKNEHKDTVTDKQLTFTNIIIQFVKEWDIDKNDYQTMDLEDAQGDGYYITQGFKVPITWRKKESDRWMRYYDQNGNELSINPGKTYISLFPNNSIKKVVIE